MIRRNPIPAAPDQRYWRRLANRRVRKARRVRGLLDRTAWVAARLFIAAVLGYAFYTVITEAHGSAEFSLRRIELTGAHRASADAIRAGLAPYLGRNLLELDLDEVEDVVERDPWVSRCSVKRVLPHTLRVGLRERVPHTRARIGRLAHLVDASGYVIGPAGPEAPEGLPLLIGLEGREGPDLAAALRRGVRVLEEIRAASADFASRVAELDLAREDRITVRTVGPSWTLFLDPERIERNVLSFLSMHAEIEKRAGEMQYVDLRWQDRIAVMPAAHSP